MTFVSVCKQVIAQNNKAGWVDPKPAIRVSNTPSGKVTQRAHKLAIKDAAGNVVATVLSSTDGEPVIKCGAKVAIVTKYETDVVEAGEMTFDQRMQAYEAFILENVSFHDGFGHDDPYLSSKWVEDAEMDDPTGVVKELTKRNHP